MSGLNADSAGREGDADRRDGEDGRDGEGDIDVDRRDGEGDIDVDRRDGEGDIDADRRDGEGDIDVDRRDGEGDGEGDIDADRRDGEGDGDVGARIGARRPTVVLTRARAENAVLRRQLEAAGIGVVEAPLMTIGPPADGGAALDAAMTDLPRYHWLVVTSANGVRAVAEAWHRWAAGDRGQGRSWPTHLRVAAVGPATERAAAEAGWSVELVPDTATAADLVASFPSAPTGGPGSGPRSPRVLAPLAELASGVIESGLTTKGYRVDRVTAYRSEAPDGAGVPPFTDAVAFFSPSAVSRFVDRGGDTAPLAVCIGPTTADRAVGAGFHRVLVAQPHSQDGVRDALVSSLVGP